jgi:hypothetical protein
MTTADRLERCERAVDAAPYVLGALADAERYRDHLAHCATCQAEVADLKPIVDTLPEGVAPIVAPQELRERIMTTVRAEAQLLRAAGSQADSAPPQRTRWLDARLNIFAGAVAAAAACALAIVLALGTNSRAPVRVTHGQVVASIPGGRAYLRQVGDRAELVVAGMPQPPQGKIYEVWLSRGSAPAPTDALFGVTRSGSASVDVPGNLHGVHEVLVTAEPLGGSTHPTSSPVLSVAVAA